MNHIVKRSQNLYWTGLAVAILTLHNLPAFAGTTGIEGVEDDRDWTGDLGDDPFADPLERLLDLLTSNVAIAVAVVGLVMAGAVLIFQGGEMKDFIKTILSVVIVAAVLVLAGNILNFFLGAGL